MRPRSCADVSDHGPLSNAARAAATAFWTSARPAFGTRAMTFRRCWIDIDSLGCNRIHELAVDVDLVLVDHDWQLRCGSGTFLGEKPDLQCRISGRLHKGLVEPGITANYMRPSDPEATGGTAGRARDKMTVLQRRR